MKWGCIDTNWLGDEIVGKSCIQDWPLWIPVFCITEWPRHGSIFDCIGPFYKNIDITFVIFFKDLKSNSSVPILSYPILHSVNKINCRVERLYQAKQQYRPLSYTLYRLRNIPKVLLNKIKCMWKPHSSLYQNIIFCFSCTGIRQIHTEKWYE